MELGGGLVCVVVRCRSGFRGDRGGRVGRVGGVWWCLVEFSGKQCAVDTLW